MVTLKELVEYQMFTKISDIEIIKLWFTKNNMEIEGLTIIAELAESHSNKLEKVLNNARSWLPNLPDLELSNKHLTHEQAQNIHKIITIYLLELDLKDSSLYEWAKEEIPKITLPRIIYVPCKEWLEQKYGIKFKE